MDQTETTILQSLLTNNEYSDKVISFVKSEYFKENYEKILFNEIKNYITKYNSVPTNEALVILLNDRKSISEMDFDKISTFFSLPKTEKNDLDWLIDMTEKFCKDKAIYNAIVESIDILDNDKNTKSQDSIPDILSVALSVSFDTNIGHDYLEDSDKRFEFYHRLEEKIPFDLDYLNKITNGGISKKTLNILMSGPGGGKSLALCHMASANINNSKNVLYITAEMAAERIAERIDANLMNVVIEDIAKLHKTMFDNNIEKIKNKSHGKLIIKEYPTGSAHAGHFRYLLKELKIKKKFVPDIIYIDYLNICSSSRIKSGQLNTYVLIKSIAEEIRGLAQEFNVPIMSATQINRIGFTDSDPGMDNTSESFGLPATADLFLAIITTEDLEQLDQVMFKQLKNRYNDINKHKRFILGIDRKKMRLYDVEENAQLSSNKNTINNKATDDIPLMDKIENNRAPKRFGGFTFS